MFKKLLVLLVALFLVVPIAKADSLSLGAALVALPALKQGIAYSIEDSKFNYLSTVEIANLRSANVPKFFKGFSLEGGYAGVADQTGHKIVGVVSYQVAKLKDFGVTLPVLDLVEFNVGYYAGYGRIQVTGDTGNDNEFDHGPSLTLLNIKW